MAPSLAPLLYALANVVLAASANACLKFATRVDETPLFVLAYLLNSSSFVVLYFLLRTGAMAVVQVFVSSGVIAAACVSGVFVFGEPFGWRKGLSALLALLSIATMYWASERENRYGAVTPVE